MKRLAVALMAGLLAASAAAQDVKIDPQAEVAAVLFAASATQAALAKSLDAKLRAQGERIARLAAELKAGDDRHRAEMVSAEEAFVAELANRDREYAAEIAAFRNAVNDIVSTPEGARALERFNAGDESGALSILDVLRASNEKMRASRLRLEDAAQARRIARLALEARTRGKVTIDAVIVRFEEVVKLDPDVVDDWVKLKDLYVESGRLADALKAVDGISAAAHDDRERVRGFLERSDVLMPQGQIAGARRAADEALRLGRRLRAAAPADPDVEQLYSETLLEFGEVAHRQGDLTAAENAYQEDLALARRRVAAENATDADRHAVGIVLLHLADTLIARGRLREARAAIEEEVAGLRELASKQSDVRYSREIAESLAWLTDIYINLGQFDLASQTSTEVLAITTRLSRAEPSNVWYASDLGLGYLKVAWLARIEGEFETSRQNYQHAQSIFQALGAADTAGRDQRLNEAGAAHGAGDASLLLHDIEGSKRFCQTAVDELRKQSKGDATDTDVQLELAASLSSLAQALIGHQDFAGAGAAVKEEQAIAQALVDRADIRDDAQYALSTALLRLGELLIAEAKPTEARALLMRCLTIRKELAASRPGNASAMRDVAEVMHTLAGLSDTAVTWITFGAYLGSIQAQGLFWPADRPWLEEVRQHGSAL
jgi:tetratricopeptide (TPR) repeat protein